MGALCEPVVSITFVCPECGMEFSGCGNTKNVIDVEWVRFLRHVFSPHEGGEGEDDDE